MESALPGTRVLRVFVSSPGDVTAERQALLRAIDELNREPGLSDRMVLRPVAWDLPGAAPLVATLAPQEAVNRSLPLPSQCDLVVVIFGERIGSPLAEPRRPSGEAYLSGTEFEYWDGIEGYRRAGRPEVIIYRRWPLPPIAADDPDREKKSEQRQMLERFFAGFFNPDGSWARSYNPYSNPAQFEQRIVPDLKRLIWAILEQRGPSQALQKAASPSGRHPDFPPAAPTSATERGYVPPAFGAALDESLPTPGDADVTGVTRALPRPGPLPSCQETISPSGLEMATRPPRQALAGRRGLLVFLLLVVVVTGVWLGVHFWSPRDEGTPDPKPPVPDVVQKKGEPPPPPAASLRLEKLEPVSIIAGQRTTVPVKVRREKFSGPVAIKLAEASPGVKVFDLLVAAGKDEGNLELEVTPDAKTGERLLRLQVTADAANADSELKLMIQAGELAKKFTNRLQMEMVLIKKGTFMMGSPPEDKDKKDDEVTQHRVKITRDFYMGATEVTNAQFRRFMKEQNQYRTDAEKARETATWEKTAYSKADNQPVVYVSWNDAVAFCEWLTKKEEKYYDLPTEAEWEYACRADGAPGQVYCFGNDPQQLVEYAWFGEPTSSGSTHAVGTKQPNNWGLYDMHGNVWEWCKDGPRKYPDLATAQKQQDPLEKSEGPLDGPSRVVRGGSWLNLVPKACRSARRYVYERGFRGSNVGFRVVLRPVPENP